MSWISKAFYTFAIKPVFRCIEKHNGDNRKEVLKLAGNMSNTQEHIPLAQNIKDYSDSSDLLDRLYKAVLSQLDPMHDINFNYKSFPDWWT